MSNNIFIDSLTSNLIGVTAKPKGSARATVSTARPRSNTGNVLGHSNTTVSLVKNPDGSVASYLPPTIKQSSVPIKVSSFDDLINFDSSNAADGNAIIYDADTDKYVVGQLNLDGGEF